MARRIAVRGRGIKNPPASRITPPSNPPAASAASKVLGEAGITVMQVGGKSRHLRAKGVSDKERSRARKQHHRDDRGVIPDISHRRDDVAQTPHCPPRRRSAGAKPPT